MNLQTAAPSSRKRPFHFSTVSKGTAQHLDRQHILDLLTRGDAVAAFDAAHDWSQAAPLQSDAHRLRGQALADLGRLEEAVLSFDRALALADTETLWAAKGDALYRLKRYDRAASCYGRALALSPGQNAWAARLADCRVRTGAPQDAMRALAAHGTAQGATAMRAFVQLGRNRDALSVGLATQDMDVHDWAELGRLAKSPADRARLVAAATAEAERADIALPYLIGPAVILGTQVPDVVTARLISASSPAPENKDTQALAHWALFKIKDARDCPDAAAEHLHQYNALSRKIAPYAPMHDAGLFTFLQRLRYTPLPNSKADILPVFICGLPGSGRGAASEFLQQGDLNPSARSLPYTQRIMMRLLGALRDSEKRDVPREMLMSLQSELRAAIAQAADGSDIVIDCNGMNFLWSGLIAAALPEARIVHLSRDPLQQGWSILKNGPLHSHLGCQHSFEHLAAYLKRAQALMHHWEHGSANIVGLSGDALLRPGGQAPIALLQHCGLNPSLHAALPAYTPNREWHRFATYLAPLRTALRDYENLRAPELEM